MNIDIVRDGQASPNYGQLFVNNDLLGQTLEDTDLYLENGGEKIYGETAIPRGEYRVVLSFSNRFQRIMPELLGVRTHSGVRIHGGNDEVDTLGCPLLGQYRTPTGIADCKVVNHRLYQLIEAALKRGEEVWCRVS